MMARRDPHWAKKELAHRTIISRQYEREQAPFTEPTKDTDLRLAVLYDKKAAKRLTKANAKAAKKAARPTNLIEDYVINALLIFVACGFIAVLVIPTPGPSAAERAKDARQHAAEVRYDACVNIHDSQVTLNKFLASAHRYKEMKLPVNCDRIAHQAGYP